MPVHANVSFPPLEVIPGDFMPNQDQELRELLWDGETTVAEVEIEKTREREVDADLKASLLRQGRYGLTPKEGRRRAKFHSAKDLSWPVPWDGEAEDEYMLRVQSYLSGMALRLMRLHGVTPIRKTTKDRLRELAPSEERLRDLLYAQALEDGGAYIVADTADGMRQTGYKGTVRRGKVLLKRSNGTITQRTLDSRVNDAVVYAWTHWDSEYTSKRSQMGHNGGKLSKPPRVYGHELLNTVAGFSKQQQAMKLGISTSMVAKLRREHPDY